MLAKTETLAPCAAALSRRKRIFDVVFAGSALVVAAPLLLFVALLLLIEHGRPALVTERRKGLGGRDIDLLRLRTERSTWAPGAAGGVARQEGPLGRFLRQAGVDRLPALVNVLKGDMSLVGPDPHTPGLEPQIEGYTERLRALPGLTGLAQVMAQRGVITPLGGVRQALDYDLRYIATWSPGLDLQILMEAVVGVFVLPAPA